MHHKNQYRVDLTIFPQNLKSLSNENSCIFSLKCTKVYIFSLNSKIYFMLENAL